jgi:bifunctional DNA-binding transcriptional regulator/antitoxin component of YhaV-PrlF toxin-antitoxin module
MGWYLGTVGERGQITLPQAPREGCGLRKGTKLVFGVTEAGITRRPRPPEQGPVWEVFGRLNKGVDTDEFIRDLRDG